MHSTSRLARALLIGLAAATAGTAQATWIHFEDLTVTDYPDSMWDVYVNPIDPQAYAAQGVVIEGGWLWPADHPYSQSMRVSNETRITFQRASLPTHVSLHARWLPEDVLDIRATGPGGYSTAFHSHGYGDGPSVPPDFGNQRISFSSAGGISSLSFADSGFMRFPALIDNVYYGNVAAVPEPASALLAVAGLLTFALRRRRVSLRQ